MVICLERGADLHMAQLMPLPLTVSGFSKIQTGFTFLVHPGSPVKKPLNGCVWGGGHTAMAAVSCDGQTERQTDSGSGSRGLCNELAVVCGVVVGVLGSAQSTFTSPTSFMHHDDHTQHTRLQHDADQRPHCCHTPCTHTHTPV